MYSNVYITTRLLGNLIENNIVLFDKPWTLTFSVHRIPSWRLCFLRAWQIFWSLFMTSVSWRQVAVVGNAITSLIMQQSEDEDGNFSNQ